VEISVHW